MRYDADTDISENDKALSGCLQKRQDAYFKELGSWEKQLDMIYHNIDVWRAAVKAIKDRYPKPQV